jgi:hypothetical protein
MPDRGDRAVTAPVTVLSPLAYYNSHATCYAVSRRSQIMHSIPRIIYVTGSIAGVALAAAGCGGSSPTTSTGSSASKPPPGTFVTDAYKYAACMRANGDANFPDPTVSHNNGGTQIAIHVIGPNSPGFNAAQNKCRGILPQPSKSELAQQAQDQRVHTQDLVSFAHCLREHGISRFPDPSAQGQLSLSEIEADGIDLQAPNVRAAALTCVSASNGAVTRQAVLQATSGNPQQSGSSSSAEGAAPSNP